MEIGATPDIRTHILVVDDRLANRVALRAILSSPEYAIIEARSGADALRALEHGEEFAVLLVDVVMPDMDGFDLAREIKRRAPDSVAPIVFLTAHADDAHFVNEGYGAGGVDYLIKPLVPQMVRAKVAVFAELHRQRKRIERQAKLLVEAERAQSSLRLLELRLASQRRYRSLAESVPNIVWSAQPDGRVDYFNRRWVELTGITLETASGSWSGALHPDDLEPCQKAWSEALRSGEMFQAECRLRRAADGADRWHLARAVPEQDERAQTIGWLGTFTDIEDQKRAQALAVDAIRARDDFLSVASHELRTPLTSLKLRIGGLLKGKSDPDDARVKLQAVAKQVDRLARLVVELTDISRIRGGGLRLEPEDVDLSAMVREVVARVQEEDSDASSSIEVRAPAALVGSWDRARIEQVVTNLLSNALKFGEGKPVEVHLEEHGRVARLLVVDHGIGIAPAHIGRIFERYEQAISPRAYGGLGLGLFIVRQIVEAHGGTIGVTSRPGEGATFSVHLPLP